MTFINHNDTSSTVSTLIVHVRSGQVLFVNQYVCLCVCVCACVCACVRVRA